MYGFNDKIVLITGASRGIGREIARQFAAEEAHIIIHYHRNRKAAEETLRLINGDDHLIVQADMKDAVGVEAMIKTAVSHYNRLDILVNNAGIYEEKSVANSDYAEWQAAWQRVINTNLTGAANAMFCAAKQMMTQGGGRIVNISSRGAFRGEPTAPAYGASKAGMNAMGQSLAQHLAPYNIFVGTVAPGFVETDMTEAHLTGTTGDAIRGQSPFGRVAKPAEVAHATLFLASEGAAFMTGTIIDVNGASYLR